MHRLAWVWLLALACGSGSETGGADAGDSGSDVKKNVACDFPCRVDWACTDSTHWVETQTVTPSYCTSGAMCESTGVMHTCDPGLECVKDPAYGSKVPCAYGGVDGCMPGDAGTFTPDAMAPPPTHVPNACDQPTIDQFWLRCYDATTRDDASCTYWQQHNTACGNCLAQTLIAAPWDSQSQTPALLPNVAGCFAAAGDPTCASKADANMQCAIAVCNAGCANDPSATAACVQAAAKTACSSFATCDADAGASATCEVPSLKDFFSSFGEALCGP